MHPLGHSIWGHIWKCTVENTRINVTGVTMYLLWKGIWGDIWKHTAEKSQTNVAFVKKDLDEMMKWWNIRRSNIWVLMWETFLLYWLEDRFQRKIKATKSPKNSHCSWKNTCLWCVWQIFQWAKWTKKAQIEAQRRKGLSLQTLFKIFQRLKSPKSPHRR